MTPVGSLVSFRRWITFDTADGYDADVMTGDVGVITAVIESDTPYKSKPRIYQVYVQRLNNTVIDAWDDDFDVISE